MQTRLDPTTNNDNRQESAKKNRDNQRHAKKNNEKHMIITIRSNRNETNKDTQK